MNHETKIEAFYQLVSVNPRGSQPEIKLTLNSKKTRDAVLSNILKHTILGSGCGLWNGKKQIPISEVGQETDILKKLIKGTNQLRTNWVLDRNEITIHVSDLTITLGFIPGSLWTEDASIVLLEEILRVKDQGLSKLTLDEDGILYSKKSRDAFREIFS